MSLVPEGVAATVPAAAVTAVLAHKFGLHTQSGAKTLPATHTRI